MGNLTDFQHLGVNVYSSQFASAFSVLKYLSASSQKKNNPHEFWRSRLTTTSVV